jgi:biotin carboxyl carrier protein
MKLIAEHEGTEHALELQRDGARVVAQVDDRHYELAAHEVEPNAFLLQTGARVYECRVVAPAATDGTTEVQIGQAQFQITLIDPKRLRHTQAADAQANGRVRVVAAMPGKVVRVLIAAGAQVEAGDALLVVEAMKMQNELKSPKAGTVIELHAAPGATVNAGDVLAVVE